MKMTGFTRQERALIILMRTFAVMFLGLGLIIAISPDYAFNYVTNIGSGLFNWPSALAAHEAPKFWSVPVGALCIALSYVSVVVQSNPAQYSDLVRIVLLSLFICAAGFTSYFFLLGRHFACLTGAIFSIAFFLLTLAIYRGAVLSRNRWS